MMTMMVMMMMMMMMMMMTMMMMMMMMYYVNILCYFLLSKRCNVPSSSRCHYVANCSFICISYLSVYELYFPT